MSRPVVIAIMLLALAMPLSIASTIVKENWPEWWLTIGVIAGIIIGGGVTFGSKYLSSDGGRND